ncbi:MAG: ArsA-related P-loop ATPase [Myxococcota bacterium]|nr:ArsA-related P-loop ATPase [Myxococcota bacterium]
MSPAAAALTERRLVVVTGKGGTGKTTVTAALGLAAARQGLRTLAVEVGAKESIAPLVAPGSPPVGYRGRSLAPGFTVMRIDPYEALAEYLVLQLGARFVVERVLANRGFRQLMNASPGWRDLITLGKVWHLERMEDAPGRPKFDLIVVDAPATGHGVAFLDVPRVVVSAVRAGPLRRHSQAVEDLIRDPERTVLLPVTLAEELPTRETEELVAAVRNRLLIPMDRLVVNAFAENPFPPGLERLDEPLRRLAPDERFGGLPPNGAIADCAAFLGARHRLNRAYERELAESTGLPPVRLPFLPAGPGDAAALADLGDLLLASSGSPP